MTDGYCFTGSLTQIYGCSETWRLEISCTDLSRTKHVAFVSREYTRKQAALDYLYFWKDYIVQNGKASVVSEVYNIDMQYIDGEWIDNG